MNCQLLHGDARRVLRDIPTGSVQTCVTSPPYFGLRDYGTGQWRGGEADCDHKRALARRDGGHVKVRGFHGSAAKDSDKGAISFGRVCEKCGAQRVDSQLGVEEQPEEYIDNLVTIFREVKRVLRDNGTLWVNIGDSFTGSGKGGQKASMRSDNWQPSYGKSGARYGLKPKNLIGIPWMLAFALRADGWYLRTDIIWHKPNAMPDGAKDRPTRAHEYLFLLSKKARYYYDADAVKEPTVDPKPDDPQYRNHRTVWSIPFAPYKGAHMAVFPPSLIEPCVLAGSAEGDTVLDPFAGACTTGLVALMHGRNFIGIELKPEYLCLGEERLAEWLQI